MSFSKILQRVIDLARRVETAHMAEDKTARVVAENELEEFLKPLKAAETYMLITVMYLGRGDTGVAGLGDAYQHMSDTFSTPSRAIGQMIEKSGSLHQYFQNALNQLVNAKIDPDTLLTTYIDSPLGVLNSSEGVELRIGPWYCDKCGQVIERADDGMLQWLTRTEGLHSLGRDLGTARK